MEFWPPLIAPLSVALALVFLPGVAVLVSAGRRGTTALMAAPALSIAIIAVSAVLFGPTGLAWSVWMPLALTVLISAGVVAIRGVPQRRRAQRIGRHVRAGTTDGPGDLPPDNRWGGPTSIANYAALAIAALLWVRHWKNILDVPNAISQTIDNIFHLSAVRFIQDTGNASSLSVGALMVGPGESEVYPAAWHGLVALVVETTGTTIPIATNAVLFGAYLAWTTSCLFLVHCLFRARPAVIIATGVLSASFASFPILLTDFGVLYPNLLGLALAPVAIGLGSQFLRAPTAVRRLTPQTSLLLLVPVIIGTGLAHPNAVLFVLLVAVPASLFTLIKVITAGVSGTIGRREVIARSAVIGGLLIVVPGVWKIAGRSSGWEPLFNNHEALGRALTNGAPIYGPAWFVTALMLLGIWRALHGRRLVWIPVAWGVLVYVWILTAGTPPSPWRNFVTSVFYSDPYRLAAALPLMALPLAVLGVHWVDEKLRARPGDAIERRAGRRIDDTMHRLAPRTASMTAGVFAWPLIAALVLVGGTQSTKSMDYAVDRASNRFDYTEELISTGMASLLSEDEYELLQQLPALLPDDAVVAVNAWNGSSLAYPLAGVDVTENHALGHRTWSDRVISYGLHSAAADPVVCSTLEAEGIEYALDFGEPIDDLAHAYYNGFTHLERAEGFELVAQEDDAALYRITACD